MSGLLDRVLGYLADAVKTDYIIEEGTTPITTIGSWTWRKWKSGKIEAWGEMSGSTSNYATMISGSIFGYRITYVPTPVTMKNTSYSVFGDWWINSGYAWQATVLGRTTAKFDVYALAGQSGNRNYTARLYFVGEYA